MSEYLSKEEVKQWRSSLEKITLEDYAARLGKVLLEEKKTNDLIDIVLKGPMTKDETIRMPKVERLTSIAQRAFEREKQISHTPFSVHAQKAQEAKSAPSKKIEKPIELKAEETSPSILNDEAEFVFSKALTDREQLVFDYFVKNLNTIVYAKDLAVLLELPRDYVYKYIKNLRAKIQGDKLKNSDNGGYVLTA